MCYKKTSSRGGFIPLIEDRTGLALGFSREERLVTGYGREIGR